MHVLERGERLPLSVSLIQQPQPRPIPLFAIAKNPVVCKWSDWALADAVLAYVLLLHGSAVTIAASAS